MEAQMHIGSVLVAIWLVIGGIAAGQRGDFKGSIGCSSASTIAGKIFGGPLNYTGGEPGYQLHGAAPEQLATTNAARCRRQQKGIRRDRTSGLGLQRGGVRPGRW